MDDSLCNREGGGPGADAGPRRGVLLALEGIDGCGKSSQALRLRDDLRADGFDAVVFREPGDTPHGDRIRDLFSHGRSVSPQEEMHLFLEDRRIDVRDNIGPALAAGRVVVMDRYYISSMAYQGALGLDPEEIRAANEAFAPRPDLVVVLDLPVRIALGRIRARRDVPNSFERGEYLERVRALFLDLCRQRSALKVECIDASDDEAEVAARIRSAVAPELERLGQR